MSQDREEGEDDAAFAQALAALKRRGSNVLLVGDAHGAACRRLLGDETPEPRHRLFVFTERDARVDARLPDADPGSVRLVESANLTRGGAVAADEGSTSIPGPSPRTTSVPPGDLAALGTAVDDAIEAFGETDPAQLRVCVDSLRPLLEDHDHREVFRLVHAMTVDVRRAKGMGHYHLPVAFDDERVALLSPLFDAVVEVRATDGIAEQRWHLSDPDVDTGWLEL